MSNSTTVYGTTGRRRATTDEQVVVLAGEQGPPGSSFGFVWRGEYSSSVQYSPDDAVLGPDGRPYIAIASVFNEAPPSASWSPLMVPPNASAIDFAPGGSIAATNVQDAIDEAAAEGVAALSAHVGNVVPDHDNYQGRTGFALSSSGAYSFSIAYNPLTRQLTLTPTGSSFDVWVKGKKFTKVGMQTASIPVDTLAGWYFYYDDTGALIVSGTFWNLREHAPVCYVFNIGGGIGVAYDERHTIYRDAGLHAAQHFSVGTFVRDGFSLSGYTLTTATEAAITPDVDAGTIMDEDLAHLLPARIAADGYTVGYKQGATVDNWVLATALFRPYVYDGGANYIQYNQFTGGAWQLTSVGSGNFCIYTLFLTPSLSGSFKHIWIPGEAVYGTLAQAQAALGTMPQLGTLFAQEIVGAWQIIFRTGSGYATIGRARIEQVYQLKTTRAQAALGGAPAVHNSLSGRSDADTHPASAITNTPSGSIAATTVQAAIDELGSEKAAASHTHAQSEVTSLVTDLAAKARRLSSQYADAGNSGAGETDLHTYAVLAGTLSSDGQTLLVEISGVLAANGNSKTVKFYVAGTPQTLVSTVASGQSWSIESRIVRASSTSLRVTSRGGWNGVGFLYMVTYTITVSDLGSNAFIVGATGQGSATNDTISKMMTVHFEA